MTFALRRQLALSVVLPVAAAGLLLAACSTGDEAAAPAAMANGSEVVTPKVDEYLAAFNAPRGAVRLSQTGFRPGYPIVAVVETDAAGPLDWAIHDPAGTLVAAGATEVFGPDAGSGASVHTIMLEGGLAAGEGLVLDVDGVGKSHPFDVGEDVFRTLKYDLLNYYYQNRAGVPIEAAFAGEAWARPAGHETETLTLMERRIQRWHCGCNQERMMQVLLPVMRQDAEGLFGDDPKVEIRCPRCAARHAVTREALEAYAATHA